MSAVATRSVLQKGSTGDSVRELQRKLRSVGYLKAGIDGIFARSTEVAIMALQDDLLRNSGEGSDRHAPVRLMDYNRGRVSAVTGQYDVALDACLSDMFEDAAFPKLPNAKNPIEENKKVVAQITALSTDTVPTPFLLAVLRQESGLRHYQEPLEKDEDTFIVVGMDRNASAAGRDFAITSRGYGAGQYTLFHHPPTFEEVQQIMLDPAQNVLMAAQRLREKFDHFVAAKANPASDRLAECGNQPLRTCRYLPGSRLYMNDCRKCAAAAEMQTIVPGVTPFHAGASGTYQGTAYYKPTPFKKVPNRANFGCDWPYAARRYNGAGVNSYWYQGLVLNHLLGK